MELQTALLFKIYHPIVTRTMQAYNKNVLNFCNMLLNYRKYCQCVQSEFTNAKLYKKFTRNTWFRVVEPIP